MSLERPFSYMQLSQVEMLEELYQAFRRDPSSVEPSWRYFFEGVEFGSVAADGRAGERGPDDLRIYHLIDAYRKYGHLQADVNPIALQKPSPIDELQLEKLNFKKEELTHLFPTLGLLKQEMAPLSEILSKLRSIYCSKVGIEYMHLHSPELERWIQAQVERDSFQLAIEDKQEILKWLNQAELFETFLHTKYVGQKRFSLEGGETLIPILSEIIEKGAELGAEEFVLGMPHRGRLNVLVNIMKKSFSMLFSEFENYLDPDLTEGAGDVKYHKGYSSTISTQTGRSVHVSLTANPSHLESVNPVVEGKTRAKQDQKGDQTHQKIIPLLIHGDASVAGQGIVYETLQLHRLEGYQTGGTLHIIVNNQIGFTTLPHEYRSSHYCSDIALAFGFPVFHVNAEDPEGCILATRLAVAIRHHFHCDVFIELNCYRKYGHNEGDEPSFTQPIEYQLIREKKSIRELYRDQLICESIVEKEIALSLEEAFKKALHFELEELKIKKEPSVLEAFGGIWKEFHKVGQSELYLPIETGVDIDVLQEIGEKLCQIPADLEIHKKLVKWIDERQKMVRQERLIDWGLAEHLAFGSLLWEKTPIRLSGQDSQRGTFTHRHAVWVDQRSGRRYFPLSHLKADQGRFTIYNSPLSEYGVLGFELGYSLAYPESLTIWEAQYGDFANGAQIIFDQYLAASAQKWERYSGLTLLLPHGFEGQGAEHSSARLERFLQLAAESNMQVVYPTTPAQYFHLLRRQMKRNIRVPLVIMAPKKLLRYAPCSSSLEELSRGHFYEIIDDPAQLTQATRLFLCSGRMYYDLIEERERQNATHCAVIRIEQLYPLNREALKQIVGRYEKVKEYYWVQEEPKNMGAFSYIYPLLQEILPKGAIIHYVGRMRRGSPATGSHALHEKEYKQLMQMAFKR